MTTAPGSGQTVPPADRLPLAAGEGLVRGLRVPTPGPGTRRLSHILDELIRVPGTNVTIGADALLALIPGVGDAAGTVMGGVILVDAVRCRVPLPSLMVMLGNVAVDAALGAVPAVGPLADMVWRANTRNLKLLDRVISEGRTSSRRGIGYLVAALGMVLGGVIGLLVAIMWAFFALVGAVVG